MGDCLKRGPSACVHIKARVLNHCRALYLDQNHSVLLRVYHAAVACSKEGVACSLATGLDALGRERRRKGKGRLSFRGAQKDKQYDQHGDQVGRAQDDENAPLTRCQFPHK
jgi:hypothetical protein